MVITGQLSEPSWHGNFNNTNVRMFENAVICKSRLAVEWMEWIQ